MKSQQHQPQETSSSDDDKIRGGPSPVRRRIVPFYLPLQVLIVLSLAFVLLANSRLTRINIHLNNAFTYINASNSTKTQSRQQQQQQNLQGERRDHPIYIEAIAERWNLTSRNAIYWLEQQVIRSSLTPQYDPSVDILAFYHPLKTGGTSLSLLLTRIFSNNGVVPGSHKSGKFQVSKYLEAVTNTTTTTPTQQKKQQHIYWDDKYRVMFGHTNFRNEIHASLKRIVPQHKKLRSMVLIRHPVAIRASNYYEWMCAVGRWIREFNGKNPHEGEQQCPKYVNLTEVADLRLQEAKKSCVDTPNINKCSNIRNGINPYDHCKSIDSLLESNVYNQFLHDMFQEYLLTDDDRTNIDEHDNDGSSHLETRALQDLGGFKMVNNSSQLALDYLFFGITERMQESICLFYYNLKLPVSDNKSLQITNERYKKCRPTDLWSSKHIQQVEEKETGDYTIWRVANAIMDVRVATMQWEIEEQLSRGEVLSNVAPGCHPLSV